jgi:poly-gamma-glutamate synthesis protein (capsule biosynthesis protein)
MIRISIAGDIICDREELEGNKTGTGYDFAGKFSGLKSFLAASDYAAVNLETPIANAPYTFERYSFNNPRELAKAVKNAGFSLVSTANNHCLDRGAAGLDSTMDNLEKLGLRYTGTNRTNKTSSLLTENIGGIKVGFLSYTYGTNAFLNKNYLKPEEKRKVNLFQEQELHSIRYNRFYNFKFCSRVREAANTFSKKLNSKMIFPFVYERKEKKRAFYFRLIKKDLDALRKNGTEYVIMCLHAGGQNNPAPLKDTIKIVNKIASFGVDAIITTHEHLVHPGWVESGVVKTLCLGNLSAATNVKEAGSLKNEYSVIINLYLEKENGKGTLKKAAFSITKSLDGGNGKIKTCMLYELIKNCKDDKELKALIADNLLIYNRFTLSDREQIEPAPEYDLPVRGV